MIRLLILCLATCLTSAEVFNANVASAELAPEYRESVPFHAVIRVRNPYPRAVRIERIDSTCSCLTTEIASQFLIPGETTTLTVSSENLRRSGPQQVRVSLFLTDPDLEPIEVWSWWTVRPAVAVDAIPPGQPVQGRPQDTAWRDIYRFIAHERPDEPQRLRKRILLTCPPEETPPGGLRIDGIDYPGTLWAFASKQLEDGSLLITATARDQQGPMPAGLHDELVVVRTNHPDKARIDLHFEVLIDDKAGRQAQDLRFGGPPP